MYKVDTEPKVVTGILCLGGLGLRLGLVLWLGLGLGLRLGLELIRIKSALRRTSGNEP